MGYSCRVAATFCSLDTSTTLHDSITNRDLSNRERDVSIAPEDSRPGREIRRVRSLGARQRATMASQGVCSWGQGQLVRTSFFTLASKDRNPSHSVIVRMPVSQNLHKFPFCRSQPRSQPSLSLSSRPATRRANMICQSSGLPYAWRSRVNGDRQAGSTCLPVRSPRCENDGPERRRCSRAQHPKDHAKTMRSHLQ